MDKSFGQVTLFEIDILSELGQHQSLRSLSRAKKLDPPHLSKILARLESKLRTRVLQRSPKGFILTPEGLRLVTKARSILLVTEELVEKNPVEEKSRPTLITLAASRFVATHILAPAVEPLRAKGIATRFRLLDMSPDELIPAALKSACEALITIGEPALSRAWESSKVGSLSWGLYASAQHPVAKSVTEEKVRAYPFIVPTYWTGDGYEMGDDYCPLPWRERIKGDETSSILTAVEVLARSPNQLVFGPRLVLDSFMKGKGIREIRVADWTKVEKPIYLSVRADILSKRTERVFFDSLVGILAP